MKKKSFLLIQNEYGKTAVNRIGALLTMVILSIAFIKEAWGRSLGSWDYIGYAVGMAVSYAPIAAKDLISSLRGNGTISPDTTNKGAAS